MRETPSQPRLPGDSGSLRRIGVDTGGTFTDCVYVDYETHTVRIAKVPSDNAEPQAAILSGIGRLQGVDVESITHGTTIATNAVITGDLASVGLITTRGFRDVLEIGTQMRPSLYRLHEVPTPAMVPRDLRLEVGGRIDAQGNEVEGIDPGDVERVAEELAARGVESITIACLFSFRNPDHETAIQEIVSRVAPEAYIGRSSSISQEPREYPRFATAVVNAGLAPRIDPYVRSLEQRLHAEQPGVALYVMQSSGGITTADRSVGEHVHRLILSGPAAGVIGAAREALDCGFRDCVTFDVGGTSADIGIVRNGTPRTSIEMTLPNGVPCKLPHIEVETIGAGGGSIAWLDAGGALEVGPHSAGAQPGPACYGRGGTEPTVTDAQLLLGRLAPAGLVGGELTLDRQLAAAALERLAERLGLTAQQAALGIIAILEQNMVGAIRRQAARHGDDLRAFVLVAGGGAGPLHAAALASELRMAGALIPPYPGLLSALGLLGADIRHDFAEPLRHGETTLEELESAFARLEASAAEALASDGVAPQDMRLSRLVDVRYVGQEYSLTIPAAASIEELTGSFHEQHEQTFGHAAPDARTELVTARLVGLGVRTPPTLVRDAPSAAATPVEIRPVVFTATAGAVDTPIYEREEIAPHQVIEGPAIVSQLDTTTVVPPGCTLHALDSGALLITSEPA